MPVGSLEFPPQWKKVGLFSLPYTTAQHEGILYQRYGEPKPSTKLAMFDMDSTLMMTPSTLVNDLVKGMKPKIGKPAVANDFILYHTNVREKLQEELDAGKAVVICSNQSQLFDSPPMTKLIFARIQLLLEELDIPLYILLASKRDLCRKPAPGMLSFYEKNLNGGLTIDRSQTFYVGDAAGRTWTEPLLVSNCERVVGLLKDGDFSDKHYMRKGRDGRPEPVNAAAVITKLKASNLRNKFQRDFSDCDYKFALNNGIQFYTPEDYFCKLPHMELRVDFDPKRVGLRPIKLEVQEGIIILVGPPASGKSFLCKTVFSEFERVSQDELKNRGKCIKVAREMLAHNRKVVIDNTNPTVSSRRPFLDLGREFNVKRTLIFLDVSKDFSLHFNRYRKLIEDPNHRAVPQVAIYSYFSHLEVPCEEEGYDKIIRIKDETFPVQHTEISMLHLP